MSCQMEKSLLSELQKVQLNILKEFVVYCEQHNLRYCLFYGSLLGTIRHSGFIPWDDDIDVCMPRKDYDKLMMMTESSGISQNIKVRNPLDNSDGYSLCMLVYDKNTKCDSNLLKLDNIGIYIDVTPVDNVPDNKIIYFLWMGIQRILMFFMFLSKSKYVGRNFLRTIIKVPFVLLAKMIGLKVIRNTLIKSYSLFKGNSKYVSILCAAGGCNKIRYKKELFYDCEYKYFEDLLVSIPKQYDKVLKELYGNYWDYPPVEERVGRHFKSKTVS